jgi:hypothetical protein
VLRARPALDGLASQDIHPGTARRLAERLLMT